MENVLRKINSGVLVKLRDFKDKEKNYQGFQVKRSNNLQSMKN